MAVVDLADVYDDGRECTFDYCKDGEAINELFPNGLKCSESIEGACYKGDCIECVDPPKGGNFYCEKPGYYCHEYWCLPLDGCGPTLCGGECEPCFPGESCNSDSDCYFEICEAGKCLSPTCDDAVSNDKETGVDCGGDSTCPRCPAGQGCVWPSDCESDVCIKGQCQAPSCTDGKKNGSEAGVDCGGPCDPC